MIDIKDTSNNIRFSTEINTGSKRKFTLMQEDYITLRFSVADPVYFKLGDHIDTELGLFELVDLYKPTLNESTGGYDYELRLDAYYWKWKNKMFKFAPEVGGNEASWKLTSTLDVHLGVFLRNLSALGYKYKGQNFEFKIDNTVSSSSKLIVYENTNLIDALTQMAETWECEWWMEDNQICFGRCEFGDPVDFEIGNNVERMERSESKATFATRVYAFGSTRNLPINYRPVDENIVVGGIVQKRLMLPVGVPFVDAYQDMTTEEAVEDVVVFDDIYPRRTGTMSSVTPVEKTENIENIDGTTTQEKFNVYQFKDTGITFSKDYILAGEELRIVFQSGALSGMDFGVIFNPNNKPEKLEDGSWNPDAQLWEIVRNEDYGRMLPGDSLVPKNGDTYNLYGFDSTSAVFGSMVLNAEKELEQAAKDYVEKTKIDPNTYSCTMMSDYMYNEGDDRTNEFTVGAKIKLINPAYFETGRVSRVIGYEFDLDIPYSSPIFTIGETASYSRISDLEQKVEELTYKGQIYTGTGAGVYIIGTNDNTSPTNKNVYSALKVLREFVRYQGWVDQPLRTFDPVQFNSITSTEFESKVKGWLIDALGNAEFRDLLIRSFKSWNFAAGPLGAGVGMVNDDELQTDKLLVRKTMYVLEMMIQRMRFQGGIIVLSPATGFKIDSVEVFDTYYRVHCRPEDLNEFEVNDQARIQNFTGNDIKYLWSLVLAKGDKHVDISRVDKDGDGVPSVGDEIVQLGNRTNPERQDAVLLSAVNGEVGLFTYFGINSFDLSGKEGSWFGKHGGKKGAVIKGEVHITSNSSGLDNFSEFEGVSQDIQDAQSSANEADRKAQEIQNYIDNTLRTELDGLHDQADGLVERWPGNYIPLPNNENPTAEANYPANQWTTEAEKQKHIDDTFTKDSGSSEYLGNSWKWSKVNGVWQWVLISDTALTAALAQSARAEETAKRKTRNFIVTPYPPYEAGDTWSQGATGDYMRCVQDRLSGSFVSSDWEKASKYTDDTKANEALQRMKDMADDNIITKEEKATLRNDLKQIEESVNNYQAQATKYGVSITALQNTYNTLKTLLTDIVKVDQNIDTSLTVAQQTTYNQNFANYYSEVTAFSSLISQKINDESIGNLQIGMVNMLKGSNVELGAQAYLLGIYYFDKKPEVGKTYTLVICYTLGEDNTSIRAYQDGGSYLISYFSTKGDRVVKSITFKYSAPNSPNNMSFYQFPNGTYGSKVHWAVLVEGNKGPNSWIPSQADNDAKAQAIAKAEAELAEVKANAYADGIVTEAEQNAINEAQARLDALKIGSVNLVSRKMMLDWNNKKDGIAVWGQDADGIYLSINPNALRTYIAEGTNAKDIFLGEGNYKSNTQYVFSIDWETATTEATNKVGLYLYAIYTDGTEEYLLRASNQQTSKTRTDYVTAKGKTIKKITSTYGYSINCLIYSLALYEGNKVLTEIPVATEDLQGQSNVNLVDGGKEVTVTAGASSTHVYKALVVPKLKPNTVYYLSFNANNLVGSPTVYSAILYRKDMSSSYFRWDSASGGIMITPNNFTETEAKLLLYAGVAGSTNGNSVKFSEVMLVEGFTPPSSYSPSPGDVAKDIKDVSDAVYNLSTTINGAFKDGIIDEAEAKAIASNISILNTEKADIDNAYTPLYNSPYLLSGSTAATNLSSAKTAYNTAHTALISEINKAIADGRATAEEKASVDAKFTDYNLALGTYKKRVEEANRAIQDRIKALAEQDATNKVDGIQIGGTNLFPISRLNTVGYRGSSSKEGSGPEIIFKCNNPSTWAILPVSIPTPVVPANTDFIISMDIRNTNGFGFEVTATSSTPTIFGKINFENTTSTWKRISQKYNSGSANNIGGINLWGVGDVRHIKIEIGNKATDWSPSPEDVDQAIQDAIAKTVDITSPSQVFKYGPGYTGTPTPSSIVLTATPRNFTPTSYQWQYLNGSTWTNISGATSSTYSIAPGNTTLFPSGTNVRTFRCICNGDEKLSDSFTIAKLADGATGADGKGVSSTVTTYQASTSGTTAPTGTWSSTIPAVPAGQFLWTRTVINYTSGSPSTMYSVSKIGADGTNGNAGNGVSSTVITYQASTSGTTAPTGTWSSSIPSVPAGQYLWTRTVINYTSGSPSTIYSVGKMGSTGAAGKDAYTILLGNESHAFAGSTAAALAGSTTCSVMAYKGATQVAATVGTISGLPTGMTASVASNGTTAPVITFTVTTSMKTASGTVNIPVTVDGKSFTKVFSYSIAFKGDTGSAGKGVKSTAIAYQASSSGTTTPTGTWSSSIPAVAAGQYLWTRTIITYTDDTTSTMYSVGRMGTNGTNGNAGNGVSSTTITYQASTSGTTAPTGTWNSSIPSVPAGQYLWTRTVINYTSGSPSTIYSVGKMGSTGAAGKDAYTILLGNESHAFAGSTAAALAGSTTCSVMAYKGATQVAATVGTISGLPTGMTASVASNGTTAPVITFTVTTSMKTASGTVNIPVTVDGKSFTKVFSYSIAFKGDTGSAGKGVKSTAIAYQASSSGTTTPTGTWSSSIPAVAAGQYLWTRTIITYTDDTTSTMYSVGRMGTNGTNGNAGNGVSSTTITYQASTSGTTAPTGTWNSSIPSVPAGQYLWTRTVINYTNGSSSTIYSVGRIGEQGIPGESINGKMLYKDPEFKLGVNKVYKYTNSSNVDPDYIASKLTVERVAKPSDAPTQSGYCLKITCKATQSPGYGGVYQPITSRANAVFVQKIIAKIPVGYKINTASNSMGTGYTDTWLTPTEGTGKYTTYLRKVVCGATGTFSAGGHVYINGGPAPTESAQLEWYIAFMTCFDQTSDGYADIEIVTKDSFAVQMGYTSFQNMIDQTVAKGGKLVVDGLLNAKLIDVEALAADTAFVNKLLANDALIGNIKANMLSVAGFTFQDHYIFGGKDFGLGPGVKITSIEGDLSFKAYKDASNYISMFYNSASDWGIIGKVDGADLLKLGPESIISGWKMKTTGFEGGDFKYPTISGSAPNYSVSGGQGSKLFPDGGIMLIPTGTGILTPSSGLMQAGLIKAEGSNAYIMGLEIIAHNNSGYGSLASVTALKLSAKNDYSTPSKRPVAIEVEAGDVNIGNGDLTLNGRFAGRLKFITLSGTSATIENDFTTGIISSVANSNMGVYIRLGKAGSIVEILNYTTTAVRLLRNDTGGLATVLRGQKTAKMYCNGETWLPVMVVDTYNT